MDSNEEGHLDSRGLRPPENSLALSSDVLRLQTRLQCEVSLLTRLVYKNRNQHKRARYFRQLVLVHKLLTELVEHLPQPGEGQRELHPPTRTASEEGGDERDLIAIWRWLCRARVDAVPRIVELARSLFGLLSLGFFMPLAVTLLSLVGCCRALIVQLCVYLASRYNELAQSLTSKGTPLHRFSTLDLPPRLLVELTAGVAMAVNSLGPEIHQLEDPTCPPRPDAIEEPRRGQEDLTDLLLPAFSSLSGAKDSGAQGLAVSAGEGGDHAESLLPIVVCSSSVVGVGEVGVSMVVPHVMDVATSVDDGSDCPPPANKKTENERLASASVVRRAMLDLGFAEFLG